MARAWCGRLIEQREEIVKPGLLLERIRGGGLGGFAFQREMHPLVAAVLLRVAGPDAFELDAEPQPPDGELAQAVQRVSAREREPAIGANGSGQPEIPERFARTR
jgi:hypothetical protein